MSGVELSDVKAGVQPEVTTKSPVVNSGTRIPPYASWHDKKIGPQGRVKILDGPHAGKITRVCSMESYWESKQVVSITADGDQQDYTIDQIQPVLPPVYVFSCRYDQAKMEDGKVQHHNDGSVKKVRNIKSAEMVQERIIGNMTGYCPEFMWKSHRDSNDELKPAHFENGASDKKKREITWKPWYPMEDQFKHVPLIFNPNFVHLNGHFGQSEPFCATDSSKDCYGNDDPENYQICNCLEMYKEGKLKDYEFPKCMPCWRSNYYGALKEHNACFQIVEHGALGAGQAFETKLMKKMGIIPADFDSDANLQSKEVYVSPDRRFIRIHTAPVDNDGEDQHLDGEAYSCKNQIWGCCKVTCLAASWF
jgi:hypothetical protein